MNGEVRNMEKPVCELNYKAKFIEDVSVSHRAVRI